MKNPKFSVLLPTYNRLELLERAIETVTRQDYSDWEVVISDNHSEEPVENFIKSLNDKRIKYVSTNKFIPVTDNWQNALNHSRGDYIIMLGDDDGLLQGYFSTLSELVERYSQPDFIYTGALLYAYPNVMPGCNNGFLKSYKNRQIYHDSNDEFLLPQNEAKQFVLDSMNFSVQFDYNMQFSLVSRKLVEELSSYGDFYQSPYPDYYASNAIMWSAKRILVVPTPLVVVGISPKSFGAYYFNNAEKEGNKFLNNAPSHLSTRELADIILPGPVMNTSWLLSMVLLAKKFVSFPELQPNYTRYRLLQICSVFADLINDKPEARQAYEELRPLLSDREWEEYGAPFLQSSIETPESQKREVAQRIQKTAKSHPEVVMPNIGGEFSTIIDVFEYVHFNQGLRKNGK
jgi:glycosyltransferase involved in cell wall biosynthesis